VQGSTACTVEIVHLLQYAVTARQRWKHWLHQRYILPLLQKQSVPWRNCQSTTVSDWCGHQGAVASQGMKRQMAYQGKPLQSNTLVLQRTVTAMARSNIVPSGQTAIRQANLSFTKYALPLSRVYLRILTGLLTGHADLNRHLTLMQIWTDAICPLCQEDEETILHLLGECSALSAKCVNILGYPAVLLTLSSYFFTQHKTGFKKLKWIKKLKWNLAKDYLCLFLG